MLLFGLVLPLVTWAVCYQISWRLEWLLLRRWHLDADGAALKLGVRRAHRISYALLLGFVLLASGWYFSQIVLPRIAGG